MKTTRIYLDRCKHCNGNGYVVISSNILSITSKNSTEVCPVCYGRKSILVTETIEQ